MEIYMELQGLNFILYHIKGHLNPTLLINFTIRTMDNPMQASPGKEYIIVSVETRTNEPPPFKNATDTKDS